MMQTIKDRNDTIRRLKAMNNKLLKDTEKLERDITSLKKKKDKLLEENSRLQNNNEELLIELKNIHNSSKDIIAEFENTEKQNISKQNTDTDIIKGISTQLYNAILRYMLNNNILNNEEDKEKQLKEFIMKHRSIQSLNIRGIGKYYIDEYNSVRRRLIKDSRKLDKII